MVGDQHAPDARSENVPPSVPVHRPEEVLLAKPQTPICDLLRFLYSSNPFYVISAGLVFFGLRSSFDTTGEAFESNGLMIGLTGYVILLAVSAWFLIRVGKVWDDVRSILLLVVLMCLAISVCFDDALATNPSVGAWYYYAGFVFTVFVSEGLLRGTGLRLPAAFRAPYYSILALFFFYPVLLSPLAGSPDDPRLHWGIFGFSSVAGAVFLMLLPAARMGRHVVDGNGSPWPWPWYPWVLFGTLALAVLGRAYYLCISMHFVVGEDSIFGPYFWIPFLLALNVLLLEILLTARRSVAMPCLAVIPIALLAVTVTGPSKLPVHLGFADAFTSTIGATPLYCTATAIAVFYGYCVFRRVVHAADFLSAWLLLFCVLGRPTIDPATIIGPMGLPFVFVAAIQVMMAISHRNGFRGALAAVCLMLAVAIDYHESLLTAYGGFLSFHLVLGIVLLTGAIVHNRFGRLLQYTGATLLAVAGTVAALLPAETLGSLASEWIDTMLSIYPYLAVVMALVYGYVVSNRWYYGVAAVILGARLAGVGWHSYGVLRRTMEGLDYLFFGFLFFVVAMLISLSKAGLLRGLSLGIVEKSSQRDDDCGG
jgi:hypothetical protein